MLNSLVLKYWYISNWRLTYYQYRIMITHFCIGNAKIHIYKNLFKFSLHKNEHNSLNKYQFILVRFLDYIHIAYLLQFSLILQFIMKEYNVTVMS